MPLPTFVAHRDTTDLWDDSNSPKATASFAVTAGDRLIAYALSGNNNPSPVGISGGSLTWNSLEALDVANFCGLDCWEATATSSTNITVTFTETSSTEWWGGGVFQFRDSDGVGAHAQGHAADALPSVNLTTTQANSAIIVLAADFEATAAAGRVWLTNAGTLTETVYFNNTSHYTVFTGYHADAGAINTYAVGLSNPAAPDYTIAAIEVKGTAAGATGQPTTRRFGIVDRAAQVQFGHEGQQLMRSFDRMLRRVA